MDPEQKVPPAADEFEVSLFGPGVGECVVVHLGENEWLIVDSCIDEATKQPIALSYLDGLGVDVGAAVKAVVVTHWHDDHIRGAARILSRASSAQVYCSAALNRDEFQVAVEASRDIKRSYGSSGLDEFAQIIGVLGGRPSGQAHGRIQWALEGTVVARQMAGQTVRWEALALSPSAATKTATLVEIAALIPGAGAPVRRAVAMGPNTTAIVLWVQAGACHALLGADLEASATVDRGWSAVIAAPSRPPTAAQIFKVPHHGSQNADEPQVWSELLTPNPTACLTPFAKSRIPRPGDLRRLTARTPDVFLSAPSEGPRAPKRDPAVEKMIRVAVRDHRSLSGRMGHVRHRAPLQGGKGQVRLFGPAFRAAS